MNVGAVHLNPDEFEQSIARWDPKRISDLVPAQLVGTCLAPWLVEGDLVFYDPALLEPVPGELVVAELWYEQAGEPNVISGDRHAVRRFSVKQWQDDGGKTWLTSNEGWIECPQHALRGVVVQVWRKDRLLRPGFDTMEFAQYRDAPLRPDPEPEVDERCLADLAK